MAEVKIYKGWEAHILINGSEIACCESASVEIARNLEPYYCIGNKDPHTIAEGNREITGSISHAMVNVMYLRLVTGEGGSFGEPFDLYFRAGSTNPYVWIYCYGCKFETGSIDIPQDGVLKEDYDFRATSIATAYES